MSLFRNDVLAHPFRALTLALRRILLNRDMGDPLWDGGEIPALLQPFSVGESLPWKGVQFKVGKVVGGRVPMVILVPVDLTRGAKLKTMRTFRDIIREQSKED